MHNADDIYSVPFILEEQNVAQKIFKLLDITTNKEPLFNQMYSLESWSRLIQKYQQEVTIAIVGKYNTSNDAYLSVMNALKHSTMDAGLSLNLKFIEAVKLEEDPSNVPELLKGVQGVVVPGGFGERGTNGKMLAIRHCRLNGVPFLGICLGLQLAVLDSVRDFQPDAVHGEMAEAPEDKQAIIAMPEFLGNDQKGGTMRLGSRDTYLAENSLVYKIYDHQPMISERFRHRYEVNPMFVERLEKCGFAFTGKDISGKRMVVVELTTHPFFMGTQFHPEFLSTPFRPSPPFLALVLAANGQLNARIEANNGKLLPGARYHS